MNKNIVIGIVLVVVLVGGFVLVGNQSGSKPSTEEKMEKTNSVMEKDDEAMDKDDAAMEKSDSRYVEYSKSALDQSSDKRRVLFFYASWCPICRPADSNFKANLNKFPEDLVLIRVNYNDSETDQEEKDLAKKYAITYQHTFVQIDKDGAEITKWNGGKTEELMANIK